MHDESPSACVLIIGNEILSGRTKDANLAYIAAGLNEVGVRLREARVIPDVPETIVVNIGDLLAQVSGGKFVATKHRVRTNSRGSSGVDGMGRFSVPFFFEPGEACVVQSIEGNESVVYGEYVRAKMGTWVEYQDDDDVEAGLEQPVGVPVEAY